MNLEHTNELLSPERINKILSKLEKTVPDFPNLSGKTVSFDYESDLNVISFTWDGMYNISEDHGNLIYDLDSDGKLIGVEILDLKSFLH